MAADSQSPCNLICRHTRSNKSYQTRGWLFCEVRNLDCLRYSECKWEEGYYCKICKFDVWSSKPIGWHSYFSGLPRTPENIQATVRQKIELAYRKKWKWALRNRTFMIRNKICHLQSNISVQQIMPCLFWTQSRQFTLWTKTYYTIL
jgi:hypothetical protein